MSPISWGRMGACALALACATARAEEPPTVSEELVVEGKRARVARDPTAAATVIPAGRYAGEAKDVAALLATAPGVAVQEYGGLGHLATVSIRGSMASGVLVLLDGIPLQAAGGAGADLGSIPRQWIARVEVLRGAEGAYYGAGALGGVVDLTTARPPEGGWTAEAGAGSFATWGAGASRAAGAGPWNLFASASADGTGGGFSYRFDPDPSAGAGGARTVRREHNGAFRGGLLLKADRPLGPGRLDLLLQVSGGHRELAGWPYFLTPTDRQDDGRVGAAARLDLPDLREGLDAGVRVQLQADRLDVRLAPVPTARQQGAAAGVELELAASPTWGRLRGALSGGGERLSGDGLPGIRSRALLSASASAELALAAWLRLTPAVRADTVGPFRGLSGKLGARVALAPWLALQLSGGRAFRAPSLAELHLQQGLVDPNPRLRSESGLSADAALLAEGAAGMLRVGGFGQRYQELIVYQRASFDRLKPLNAGQAAVGGLELEAASAPFRRLLSATGSAAYTWMVTRNLRGGEAEVGSDLPFRARHRLYLRASVAPDPVGLHVELHRVGRQYRDLANTAPVAAATIWNAGGSVRLARRPALRLHLEVRNLADDLDAADPLGNPLPGRMVMVTLRAGSTPEGAP